MLIPSIDLRDGCAVQLVGGKDEKLNAGDPIAWMRRFTKVGEVAVVDLDAALGTGSNRDIILQLCKIGRCRVGGGIRTVEDALFWLDSGASSIVIGTAATPDLLAQLPKDRVVVALDCFNDEVVVKGWTENTGRSVYQCIEELRPFADRFLITWVEREGRLGGLDIDRAQRLVEAVSGAKLTVAGGIKSAQEVAQLDEIGADAQVGMALYEGVFDETDCLWEISSSDRADGLVPTVICNRRGTALGLAYTSKNSLRVALESETGTYQSRKRGLWTKGATSGATQRLFCVDLDCDRDTFRFTVEQSGPGFCHVETATCWGQLSGLEALQRTVVSRINDDTAESYTTKLLRDPALLNDKILEEADELVERNADVVWEAADLFYFASVKLAAAGCSIEDVDRELDRRSQSVSRRSEKNVSDTPRIPIPNAPFLVSRTTENSKNIDRRTRLIVDDVATNGEEALRQWSESFGDLEQGEKWFFNREEIAERATVGSEIRSALTRTKERIERFAQAQRESLCDAVRDTDGLSIGHTVMPVGSVGCYAPGGRYPLPSSVLMTAVTARVAGVERVLVSSPKPTAETFAAADIAGADFLLSIGGAQAIAALAFGIEGLFEPVDVIVGPGNDYVTAAKRIVFGTVGIDALAGPSELVVVADDTANPVLVAADLIAQAEHDPAAVPILIAFSNEFANSVRREIVDSLPALETADIAFRSLTEQGKTFVAKDIEQAANWCNQIAPEHLQVLLENTELITPLLRNYGGLFLGESAAEVFGDYGAGPNHVLPTGGSARFASGLSVFNFLRTPTFMNGSPNSQLMEDVVKLAAAEGLLGHRASALLRRK